MALTAIRKTASTALADGMLLVASPALLVPVPLLLLGVRNGDMLGAVWLPLSVPIPLTLMLVAMVDGLTAELERMELPAAERVPYTAADAAVEVIVIFEVDAD